MPALLKLLVEIKKQKFQNMITQKNRGKFMASPPIVRKIGRKIILVFHYFACIERNTSQVFSTGYVENIKEALEIYE